MKNKPMLLVLIVGILTLAEGAVLFVSYKTDLFQKQDKKQTVADTVKSKKNKPAAQRMVQVAGDTVSAANKKETARKDTVDAVGDLKKAVVVKSDSIALLLTALGSEEKKSKDLADQLKSASARQTLVQDQKRKELQKIYNTMDAESAARIVEKLSDQDIVDILLSVQKRQAAKILASLDPGRAAKLINQVNTNN